MKKYNSPAVTSNASPVLLDMAVTSMFDPQPFQQTLIASVAKSIFSALLGEDFTELQVDSLTPCLEA